MRAAAEKTFFGRHLWRLQGDDEAGGVFAGGTPELLENPLCSK